MIFLWAVIATIGCLVLYWSRTNDRYLQDRISNRYSALCSQINQSDKIFNKMACDLHEAKKQQGILRAELDAIRSSVSKSILSLAESAQVT